MAFHTKEAKTILSQGYHTRFLPICQDTMEKFGWLHKRCRVGKAVFYRFGKDFCHNFKSLIQCMLGEGTTIRFFVGKRSAVFVEKMYKTY